MRGMLEGYRIRFIICPYGPPPSMMPVGTALCQAW